MLRKCLMFVVMAAAFTFVGTPNTARALTYVNTSHPRYVTEYMVQYRCPQTGAFHNYRTCTTGAEITQAMYQLFGRGYTARYVVNRTLTYYYVYTNPQFPSLGYWQLQNR